MLRVPVQRHVALALVALAGCGDDDGRELIDSPRAIDGRADAQADAWALPDGRCERDIDFFPEEGGEVRFEYVRLQDGTASARVTAYFEADDDVDFHDYPALDGSCTLMTDDTKWPTAQPQNRVYVDVGTVSITNGAQTLVVPTATTEIDPLGRRLGAGNWYYHYDPAANDAATYVTEKTAYDVVLGGSVELPAQTLTDAIVFPGDFDLLLPDATVSPVALQATTALELRWEVVDSMAPAWSTPAWVMVWFSVPDTGPIVMCVETMNDGAMTVPANMVDAVRAAAPSGGTLFRQVLHHNVKELTGPTVPCRRRLDMIGSWAYEYPFSVP